MYGLTMLLLIARKIICLFRALPISVVFTSTCSVGDTFVKYVEYVLKIDFDCGLPSYLGVVLIRN